MARNVFSRYRRAISTGVLAVLALAAPLPRLLASGGDARSPASVLYRPTREPLWAAQGHLVFGFKLSYGFESPAPRDVSHVRMTVAEPEVGVIAWDSPRSRLPVECLEIISEGLVGTAYRPGGYLVGTSLLLRFGLRPVARLVPFVDAGSGPVWTTLNQRAREISGRWQFVSEGGGGVRYFFKPQRALMFEYRYFHMSNGGLQEPNFGLNGSMVTVGLSWQGHARQLLTAGRYRRPLHWLHLR